MIAAAAPDQLSEGQQQIVADICAPDVPGVLGGRGDDGDRFMGKVLNARINTRLFWLVAYSHWNCVPRSAVCTLLTNTKLQTTGERQNEWFFLSPLAWFQT